MRILIASHWEAQKETGFWGRRGAGCIFLAQSTGRILLALRSKGVNEPNTWGTWGGAIDEYEDPEESVLREVEEESKYEGQIKLLPLSVFKHQSGFVYYNFLAVVPEEFTPKLNWETEGWKWCHFGSWPSPLHPGLNTLLKNRNNLEIIKRAFSETHYN